MHRGIQISFEPVKLWENCYHEIIVFFVYILINHGLLLNIFFYIKYFLNPNCL